MLSCWRSARKSDPPRLLDTHTPIRYTDRLLAGFNTTFWRNTILAVVLSFATYRLSLSHAPSAKPINLDETHDPEAQLTEAKDADMPYLTRYLAYHMPREGMWKERNDKHFELTVKQAEDKLLLQDAQRPKIRRFRYSGTFEQASPHGESVLLRRLQAQRGRQLSVFTADPPCLRRLFAHQVSPLAPLLTCRT